MENSGEKLIKIRVKKGYTLHIGGEYYVEGEVINVRPSQVEDQLWKIEHIKEAVVEEVVKEQPVDTVPEEEAVPANESVQDVGNKKTTSGRRLFKNKQD